MLQFEPQAHSFPMSPLGPSTSDNFNSDLQNDFSQDPSRQQAFASEGDALFLPTNGADEPPSFRPHDSNPFLSAPSAPLVNPFMNHTSPNPPSEKTPDINTQQANFRHDSQASNLPLPRTGFQLSSDTRHSSPSQSVGSASVLTNHVHDQKFVNNHNLPRNPSLPLIPDIRSELPKHSVPRANIPSLGLKNENHYQLKILFSTHIANANLRKNPKNGHFDILMKIIMQARPADNAALNSKATHMVHKWYSELNGVHGRLGLSQHGITFPVLRYMNNQQEGPIPDSDVQSLQKYISTITEAFLNVDHRNQIAEQFLCSLEDESKSLSDKIRMLLLESRLVSTMNCCDQLQNRLHNAEKSLTDSSNLVSFLKYRVEQLENTNSASRSGHLSQSDHLRQQAYSNTSVPAYNNSVDPMLLQNMRLDGRSNAIPVVLSAENNINPSQLVTLAESVLNEKGPLPVGEVGKMLQEATGNPSLSQILKERHNGLKKFLEKYSDKFIMSCDHPFNPHVYLRRSYSPDDQLMIESGSTAFLDKKVKKTRRKEKKNWPLGVPSPTLGSWNQPRIYS